MLHLATLNGIYILSVAVFLLHFKKHILLPYLLQYRFTNNLFKNARLRPINSSKSEHLASGKL
jgi:hypothetical protein